MPHLTPLKLPKQSLFSPPSILITPPSTSQSSINDELLEMPNLRSRTKPEPPVDVPTEGRGLLSKSVKLGKRPAPIDEEMDPDEDEVEAMRRRKRLRIERERQISEQQEDATGTPDVPTRRLGRGLRLRTPRSTRRGSSSTATIVSVISHITPPNLSPLQRAAYCSEEDSSESPTSFEKLASSSDTSSRTSLPSSDSSRRGRSRTTRILNHHRFLNPPILPAHPSAPELLIDPASTPFTLAASQQNSPLKPGKRKRQAKGGVKKRGKKGQTGGAEEAKEMKQAAITRFFKAVGGVFGYKGNEKERETEEKEDEDEEIEEGDPVEGESEEDNGEERENVPDETMADLDSGSEKSDVYYDQDAGNALEGDDKKEAEGGEVINEKFEKRAPSIPTTITTEPTAETRASQREDEVEDRIDAYFNSMEDAADEEDDSTMDEIGIQRKFLLSSPDVEESDERMLDQDMLGRDHWIPERPMTPRSPKRTIPTSSAYDSFRFVPSTNIPATGLFLNEDSEAEDSEDERASRSKDSQPITSTNETIEPTSHSDRHDTVKRSGLPNFIADFFNLPRTQTPSSSLTTSIPLSNSNTTIITVNPNAPKGPIATETVEATEREETENKEEPRSRRELGSTQQALAFFKDVSGLGTQRWERLVGAPKTSDDGGSHVGKEGNVVVQEKQFATVPSEIVQSSQPSSYPPPSRQKDLSYSTAIIPCSITHRLPLNSPAPLHRPLQPDSALITPPTSEYTTPQTSSQTTITEPNAEPSSLKQPIPEPILQAPNSELLTDIQPDPAHEHDEYCTDYPELCAGRIVTFPVNSSPVVVLAEPSLQSITPPYGDSGAEMQQKLRIPSPKATLRKEESMPRVYISGAYCGDHSHAAEDASPGNPLAATLKTEESMPRVYISGACCSDGILTMEQASPSRATLQKEESMPRVYTSGVCFGCIAHPMQEGSPGNPPGATLKSEESMPRVYVAGRCFSAPTQFNENEIKEESQSLPMAVPSLKHQTSHVHDEFCGECPETCRGIYEGVEERDRDIKVEPVWD